jgi:Na+/proline symporter
MEQMQFIDWSFIVGFFVIALAVGVIVSKQAGKSESDFFLGGRSMPWWLLGFSMVATTFSTDTPNLVTDLVRGNGVAGNWCWWAFLLTGMLTVFVYARLWRRSKVFTDVEFYEIRYSGKSAAFLRGFRALYLGVIFNVVVMAAVSLAAIKIGGVMLGLKPIDCILYASIVTVIFTSMGGFKGVLITDFLLFIMAMVGAFAAAYFALNHEAVNFTTASGETLTGLKGMVANFQANPDLKEKLSIIPAFKDKTLLISLFVIPLAVQWWAAYYPGAEPGGGGYLVQRMLAAKDEKHALGATLFFNVAHYALRPWPWIIVALCSILVYPMGSIAERDGARLALKSVESVVLQVKQDPAKAQAIVNAELAKIKFTAPEDKEELSAAQLSFEQSKVEFGKDLTKIALSVAAAPQDADKILTNAKTNLGFKKAGTASLRAAFDYKRVPNDKMGNDLAYSAMLRFLPPGWFGLLLTSLIAAYMSTVSTHLNWGSSYVVNDFYLRFLKPEASQKELVWVGRISTCILMVAAGGLALVLNNAAQLFNIILMMGAGTGLLFILRWFWWRINAISEIVALIVSFSVSLVLYLMKPEYIDRMADVLAGGYLDSANFKIVFGVAFTTVAWVIATLVTKPAKKETLYAYCKLVNPSIGWKKIFDQAEAEGTPIISEHKPNDIAVGILCMVLGSFVVYATLFATGYWIYGETTPATVSTVIAVISAIGIILTWGKVAGTQDKPENSEINA